MQKYRDGFAENNFNFWLLPIVFDSQPLNIFRTKNDGTLGPVYYRLLIITNIYDFKIITNDTEGNRWWPL